MPVFELLCLHFLWKDKSVCVCVCVCTWIVKKKIYISLGHAAELEKKILKGVMRVLKGLACLSSGYKIGSKSKKGIGSHRYTQALALVSPC